MNKDEPACPLCRGLKVTYRKAGDDSRREEPCWQCGGSGLLSDAVYAKLSGEDLERREEARWKPSPFTWSGLGLKP